jgi:lactate racemase
MKVILQYGNEDVILTVPEDSIVYESKYQTQVKSASGLLLESFEKPTESNTLRGLLLNRKSGKVVIVVSDITRPIPYHAFLPQLLTVLELNGVKRDEIIILIATGMHRESTLQERQRMFGEDIVNAYKIIDHHCDNDKELQELEGRSWSGSRIKLNKHYVQAGFRIITGLVEPHFMAGFSGGRKAICPGLISIEGVRKFHGYQFLNHPNATNAILKDNPCNEENTSVAKLCPPDFAINIVLDNHKKVNAVFTGELFSSHRKAVEYVKAACCPEVKQAADLVITSAGGYPLDATFYQCVKGFVSCLPAVKDSGEIIAFGSCQEGIGSPEYTNLMKKYSGRYLKFIEDIKDEMFFIKDQWQLQMHIKALDKTGQKNLHFYTSNISQSELSLLSVNPHSVRASEIAPSIQGHVDLAIKMGKRIAVFPEGPYCAPLAT